MGQKIKIKLSYFTYSTLLSDMFTFGFYKNDGSINKNLFMNTLVYQYSAAINKAINDYNFRLAKMLSNQSLPTENINNIIDEIALLNAKSNDKHKLNYEITFVVTSKFQSAFDDIEANYLTNINLSEYLRKLLNSYARLSQDEREKILFHDSISIINLAIKDNKKILIDVHDNKILANPIGVFTTKDKIFSYFVYHINKHLHSIRISKLTRLTPSKEIIDEYDEDKSLKEFLDNDFQYLGNKIENIQISLTEKGIKMFNKIISYRPIPNKINGNVYSFNASRDQLFFYFSRFGKEATVINDEKLNESLYYFYMNGYKHYKIKNKKPNQAD